MDCDGSEICWLEVLEITQFRKKSLTLSRLKSLMGTTSAQTVKEHSNAASILNVVPMVPSLNE